MKQFNRDNRRSVGKRFGSDRDFNRPSMHEAVCDECGRECEVPFRPTGDKPIYCNDCFRLKRDGGSGKRDFRKSNFADKKRYTAICSKCGTSCEVPFKPTDGKPVYCDKCFSKGSAAKKETNISQEQFEMLNAKLDKILKLLISAIPTETAEKIVGKTEENKISKLENKNKTSYREQPAEKKDVKKKVAAKNTATEKTIVKKSASKKKK